MNSIMFYTHGQLDRADHLRKTKEQQSELFNSSKAVVLPVWHGKLLVGDTDKGVPQMLSIAAGESSADEQQRVFLGLVDAQPVFAMSI